MDARDQSKGNWLWVDAVRRPTTLFIRLVNHGGGSGGHGEGGMRVRGQSDSATAGARFTASPSNAKTVTESCLTCGYHGLPTRGLLYSAPIYARFP